MDAKMIKTIASYNASMAKVQQQIARIQSTLVMDVSEGFWLGEHLTHGHVGDLAHLADELKSAADFITGEVE